jgi:microcystin-dependent protein
MEGYIAEIRLFAANFAPRNWAYCQGQIISIAQNTALFSLLGTTYGGNGQTTFGLPNFASRQARGTGTGQGLSNIALGEMAGAETATLTTNTMPNHTHTVIVKSGAATANTTNPINGSYGPVNVGVSTPPGVTATGNLYATTSDTTMNQDMVNIGITGNNQPFMLLNPYLGMNYIICMYGIFPSRS